jgi:hypothetical protein
MSHRSIVLLTELIADPFVFPKMKLRRLHNLFITFNAHRQRISAAGLILESAFAQWRSFLLCLKVQVKIHV